MNMDAESIRRDVLNKAIECVCGQREQDYGSPENNFKTIAELWSAYKSENYTPVTFTPLDVAVMMALVKIARIKAGGTLDCFVDLAGYAACGAELWQNK